MQTRAVSHIVIDRLRKRIGLLEHHAYLLAQAFHFHFVAVNIFAADVHFTFNACSGNHVVHTV
ncbi:hypothetical protein D3C80_1583660 [compost metagenome]